ncbi:MAG TPA: LysR family transcriptional regulator [Jatrophihabitans sp.]
MSRLLDQRLPRLGDLELLEAAARLGSLSAAAREFGLTQQAVSLRIRAVERQLGVSVLTRSPSGCGLTQAGRLVTAWSATLLRDADQFSAALASLPAGRSRRLRVAASLSVAEHLVPGWLVTLNEQQSAAGAPATRVELAALSTPAVLERVRSGHADIGFIEGPQSASGLRTRTFAHDELVIVVAPGHPWARRRAPVPVTLLASTPLVHREPGSGARQAFDDALAAALPAAAGVAEPALVVTTPAASRAAVLAGVGPSAVPARAVADDLALRRLVAVPVAGLDLHRALRAVWAGDTRLPAGPARDLLAIATQGRRRA